MGIYTKCFIFRRSNIRGRSTAKNTPKRKKFHKNRQDDYAEKTFLGHRHLIIDYISGNYLSVSIHVFLPQLQPNFINPKYDLLVFWSVSFVNLHCIALPPLQISCGSQGEFQLRLRNFEYRNSECFASKCQTSFHVCLKHYQKKVELNDECTFGESYTHSHREANTVAFPLDFKWPVSRIVGMETTSLMCCIAFSGHVQPHH